MLQLELVLHLKAVGDSPRKGAQHPLNRVGALWTRARFFAVLSRGE